MFYRLDMLFHGTIYRLKIRLKVASLSLECFVVLIPGCGTLPVDEYLLDAVLLHLELAERAELGEASERQLEVAPVGVLLTDLVPDGEKPLPRDLQRLQGNQCDIMRSRF